jgi:hypothetical protein
MRPELLPNLAHDPTLKKKNLNFEFVFQACTLLWNRTGQVSSNRMDKIFNF